MALREVTDEDVVVAVRSAAKFGVQAPDGSGPACIWCGVPLPASSPRKSLGRLGFRCARRPGYEQEDQYGNAECFKRQYG